MIHLYKYFVFKITFISGNTNCGIRCNDVKSYKLFTSIRLQYIMFIQNKHLSCEEKSICTEKSDSYI